MKKDRRTKAELLEALVFQGQEKARLQVELTGVIAECSTTIQELSEARRECELWKRRYRKASKYGDIAFGRAEYNRRHIYLLDAMFRNILHYFPCPVIFCYECGSMKLLEIPKGADITKMNKEIRYSLCDECFPDEED